MNNTQQPIELKSLRALMFAQINDGVSDRPSAAAFRRVYESFSLWDTNHANVTAWDGFEVGFDLALELGVAVLNATVRPSFDDLNSIIGRAKSKVQQELASCEEFAAKEARRSRKRRAA